MTGSPSEETIRRALVAHLAYSLRPSPGRVAYIGIYSVMRAIRDGYGRDGGYGIEGVRVAEQVLVQANPDVAGLCSIARKQLEQYEIDKQAAETATAILN